VTTVFWAFLWICF